MHLKSLTMKGFKSFASATTLRFEPGITAVVGPNGSGKSNVVDAIAWVLGEQGAKALRGGKMEDVIFAGTAGRAPLGRAEVTLTIDNTDGALPIDYTEVSITRRMFRDGASEYEINGDTARLLDIQELLSDSGIGREMHVIVGQGQLDNVLQARPEDRRGFIEEAAGVLKHRKRKEKALRKLDGLQANLTRITDLTGELGRQLKPLGRQAELARRAAGVQAELRDSRLRLLADDLLSLQARISGEDADDTAIRARRAEVEDRLRIAGENERELDTALQAGAPELDEANRVHFELAALSERLRGTEQLARERVRNLSGETEVRRPGRDPDELDSEAERAHAEEQELEVELGAARQSLTAVLADRQEIEQNLARAERDLLAAARAAADRREGLATLTGRVNSLRARSTAAADELTRISTSTVAARERIAQAQAELEAAEGEAGGVDDNASDLDARYERAQREVDAFTGQIAELTEALAQQDRETSTLTARRDALALGLDRRDGGGAVLEAATLQGVLGPVSGLVTVRTGDETAIAAALSTAADAVAVESPAAARAALEHLKATSGGRTGLVVAAPTQAQVTAEVRPALPSGCRWAMDVISGPAAVRASIAQLLGDVVLVADLEQAVQLIEVLPDVRAVTADGDVLGRHWAEGGSASSPGALQIRSEVDQASARLDELATSSTDLAAELVLVRQRQQSAQSEADAALEVLHSSDAQFNAIVERLAQLSQSVRLATAEADRLEQARTAAETARDNDLAGLAELEERLRLAEAEPVTDEPSTTERDSYAEQLAGARQAELEARLSVRTREERVRALSGRAEQLRTAARAERDARAAEAAARIRRTDQLVVARAVAEVAAAVAAELTRTVARAADARDAVKSGRIDAERQLAEQRGAVRELGAELASLTAAVHRDEVARAEQRLRVEALHTRAVEEFGIDPATLVAEYGPDQPVPPSNKERAEVEQLRERGETVLTAQPGPFDRAIIEKRAAHAERDLALLGKVNPLALEEFAALEERHQFLATQLEDLKKTRRDLLTVVKEVDDKILAVFSDAYADVAREFVTVFAGLFPGGEGRLILTDPDDMLMTGIDIEARPPGKKVKRLSLLSGGERSLTAVALLVAIFRARPSPFYVMDEIEAALDDVNLGRLIGLISELRASSQIIVITHQKRTMESADALYGVTMRGDGISQVISQRL